MRRVEGTPVPTESATGYIVRAPPSGSCRHPLMELHSGGRHLVSGDEYRSNTQPYGIRDTGRNREWNEECGGRVRQVVVRDVTAKGAP